ncbi:MAG: ABC transporter permease [Clostridia bacterium]|nr:ABC transporter permease [Clostridia bacterium]
MGQFGKIFKFELKNYLTNKIFVGVTVFFSLIIALVMFFPRVAEIFESNDPDIPESSQEGIYIDEDQSSEDVYVESGNDGSIMLLRYNGENSDMIKEAFSNSFWGYNVEITEDDISVIEEKIRSGEAECAFVLDDLNYFTYYVGNLSMYDMNSEMASELLRTLYQQNSLMNSGLSEEEALDVLNAYVSYETVTLGKDQMVNYFYTYIMILALYMVILLYGQMVSTNVATEKSSRAMELLITSAKPSSMMFGKVFASCLAGFTQLVCIFGSAFVSFNINRTYWDEFGMVSSFFDIPIELIIYMLVFFVLGFLVYAFIFGAVGSTVSKLEDINTAVMPITLLFIFGFMVVVFSFASGTVDNILMKVCSYIPFTAPIAMFARIAMSTVPWYEITICISVLTLSVVFIGIISAKIYRVGVLLYGTPPKIGAILKAIKKA